MLPERVSLKSIIRKTVYALNNGAKLGKICDVYLDREFTRLAAIEVKARSLKPVFYFLSDNISTVGRDIVIIDDYASRRARKEIPFNDLIVSSKIFGAPVIIERQVKIGKLSEVFVAPDKTIVGWTSKMLVDCPIKSGVFIRRDMIADFRTIPNSDSPAILVNFDKYNAKQAIQ